MPDLIEMIVFKVFTSWQGPTQKLTESQLTIMCKLAGPQHREFQKEILQTMQVGERGPTQKVTKSQHTIMCKLAGPNIENFKRNSTDNASWGSTK